MPLIVPGNRSEMLFQTCHPDDAQVIGMIWMAGSGASAGFAWVPRRLFGRQAALLQSDRARRSRSSLH